MGGPRGEENSNVDGEVCGRVKGVVIEEEEEEHFMCIVVALRVCKVVGQGCMMTISFLYT